MNRIAAFFLYPISWIYLLTINFRRKMFELGRWKSVEFEIPTLSIVNESNTLDFDTMNWISSILYDRNYKSYLFTHLIEFDPAGLVLEPYDNCDYLMRVKGRKGTHFSYYDTRFSKILGMSEAYVQFEDLEAFIVYESKFHTEIRSDIKILIIDSANESIGASIWPLSSRKHAKEDLSKVDFVIINTDEVIIDDSWLAFIESLDSSCCVTTISSSNKISTENLEVAEYLPQQIDIIVDHDTFGRLLIQKVEEVSRKKQSDVEN